MNPNDPGDLSNLSMLELFRVEAENQTAILTGGLLELERSPAAPERLESLMRAAHSLKGAARIVNLPVAVRVAHAMEDCFVQAQRGSLLFGQPEIDVLFRGVDLLTDISRRTEATIAAWETDHAAEIEAFLDSLGHLMRGTKPASQESPTRPGSGTSSGVRPSPGTASPEPTSALEPVGAARPADVAAPGDGRAPEEVPGRVPSPAAKTELDERVLRLTAENLNRLLGLAGESLVASRWLRPFAESLQRLKRQHEDLAQRLEQLRQVLQEEKAYDRTKGQFSSLFRSLSEARQFLGERLLELDTFDRRSAHLSHRLYLEVLRARMRPFSDGVRRFPRMVRDLARSLGKEVKLEIQGENTPVDRDILERLESPLVHLLRNAVDHGCEFPEARLRAGKPAEGVIRLEARHSAGTLVVTVTDDGGGVQPAQVRKAVVSKGLVTAEVAESLPDSELLQFLFLPGFTMKESVTEISGRGVGLDVVQNMVRGVRGAIRILNQPGRGMRFQLQLPITLSVLRALLVEAGGEPFAIPLTQITRTLKLARKHIETLEGRHHFRLGEHQVGLLPAHQVLDCGPPRLASDDLPVVVLGDRQTQYGLVVDRFLGERELVVQPLDPRLGKVKDISAAALMEDGAPVLIVDVDDTLRSIEALVAERRLAGVQPEGLPAVERKPKRVLVADDSLTARELERKLLANHGYQAEAVVDGAEAWEAVRAAHYDLVITDIEMPRLNGFELTALIKKEPRLRALPVLIVSYKDNEEERFRGLEAGADYYLTKGSFHDEKLLQAVVDLIGEP